MRTINRIIVHCSATKHALDIGMREIRKWHMDPKPLGNGWSNIGYHFVIRRDGTVEKGRPERRSGAHAKGYNSDSIGICLVGGLDKDLKPCSLFDERQFKALRLLIEELRIKYNIKEANVLGHRDLPKVAKACPCFQVQKWLTTNQLTKS